MCAYPHEWLYMTLNLVIINVRLYLISKWYYCQVGAGVTLHTQGHSSVEAAISFHLHMNRGDQIWVIRPGLKTYHLLNGLTVPPSPNCQSPFFATMLTEFPPEDLWEIFLKVVVKKYVCECVGCVCVGGRASGILLTFYWFVNNISWVFATVFFLSARNNKWLNS